MVGKTPSKLLCGFEVKVIVTNSWLGINFLALADIRFLGADSFTWPHLISELLVAGSSWPRTFLHPRCFCLANTYRQQEVTICTNIEVNTSSISDKMYLLWMHCQVFHDMLTICDTINAQNRLM